MDYQKTRDLVAEAISGLESVTRDEIDALADKPMVFRSGDREAPFTAANFILSFSLPNFYFHAATTYAVLRMHGVPLGKMDYLGAMRVGVKAPRTRTLFTESGCLAAPPLQSTDR